MSTRKANTLTDKQKMFCDQYLISFNATRSAIKAGYSKKTSNEQGSRLLANVSVRKYLESKKLKLTDKLEISQEKTLREMGRLGYSDIRKLFTKSGAIKPVHQWDDDIAAAVSSIEIEERIVNGKKIRTIRPKLWDKVKPVEMLGKHFKIYEDITPVIVNNQVDIGGLSAADLKTLLDLKKKVTK